MSVQKLTFEEFINRGICADAYDNNCDILMPLLEPVNMTDAGKEYFKDILKLDVTVYPPESDENFGAYIDVVDTDFEKTFKNSMLCIEFFDIAARPHIDADYLKYFGKKPERN